MNVKIYDFLKSITSILSLSHRSFSNSSGMTNSGFTSMELFQSSPPQKKDKVPFFFSDSTNRCKALHVIWKQLHGSFSDIGAHQNFQMPEFFMPELLLQEPRKCPHLFRDELELHLTDDDAQHLLLVWRL